MSALDPLVFVVGENRAERETLVSLIRSAGWVTECLASLDAFLARPVLSRPTCLILEVSNALLDGSAFQRIATGQPETPVVFTTSQRDIAMTVRAMKAGAVDLLTRPFAGEAILAAIRAAVDRSRQMLLHEMAVRGLRGRYESLSGRERQVLGLVVAGLMNKHIGAELGISEITVKAHRGRMMRKMQAASLAELVNMAGRLRIDTTSTTRNAWPPARGGVSRLVELAATLTGARTAC